ncbi:carnosine synthase 1 isoform X1 [Motacilla alba alba]|uniref:carnosine synthase 1 isoform X1 n=3 Tax=Motacilla alba alba TaxID=1094192 RepID=UPI0018D50CC1|nr:carnosine synthase 1 isoform X1 [Motacilla alba alba]
MVICPLPPSPSLVPLPTPVPRPRLPAVAPRLRHPRPRHPLRSAAPFGVPVPRCPRSRPAPPRPSGTRRRRHRRDRSGQSHRWSRDSTGTDTGKPLQTPTPPGPERAEPLPGATTPGETDTDRHRHRHRYRQRRPRVTRMLSRSQPSAERVPSPEEQEWAGPEALCPGWLEDEAPDGEVPGDSGDPDGATHAYERLQSALCQEGLPPTLDCSAEPRTGFGPLDMTVCILGCPTPFLPVLLEGGTRCPGAMVLCLSPTWASRVPSESSPGSWSLLLSRGVSFKVGGHSALETFEPPRRANYVTGTFAPGDPEGGWVGELARDLDCPTGGSVPLAHRLEDTLVTRWVLAARAGLPVPPTLAFVLGARGDLPAEPAAPGVRLVRLQDPQGQQSLVQEEVGAFLGGTAMEPYGQVVVRPAGWRWRGTGTRSTHRKEEGAAVAQAVGARLRGLTEEDSVLLEAMVPTARLPVPPPRSPAPRLPMALRICTLVCRSWGDRPQLCQVACAVGRAESPVRHGAALPQGLDSSLQQWGVVAPGQRRALATRLREATEAAAAALLAAEAELSPRQRGGARARTDILGVDFLLACVDEALELVALAANGQRCLETCALAEAMGRGVGEPRGELPRLLAEAVLHRAQRHLVEGKDILLIGAGGVSKSFVWEAARDYGLRIHLVESDPEHFAAGLVQTFLPYDSREHRRDEEHAERVLELLRSRGLRPHACLSYWDDCVVLAALVCQGLGLRGPAPAAVRVAKQKSRTHRHLQRCRRGRPPPAAFAVPCRRLRSHGDVERAAGAVPFPAVAKLEFGAGGVGVRLVENAGQCHAHAARLWRDLRDDADHPGIGLGWGNAMLLMEYVPGTEHDVDLVVFEGRLLGAWVSDNGPTRVPAFLETAACLPSCLPADRQAQLVRAALQCCRACGLRDGVFNVELKLGPAGPRLLEINPRMGGFYLRDWIREVYGPDLLLAAVLVALGVPPVLPARPAPRTHLAGVMCLASEHGDALAGGGGMEALRELHGRGLVRLNRLFEEPEGAGEYEEPLLSVACAGATLAEACERLLGLCQGLGIDSPRYPVEHFLSHFK